MQSLERLDAYRLSRELSLRLYRLTRSSPLTREPALADQIRRAAISIPANIAEAFGLGTRPQLVKGLRIALGSAEELKTHLWIAGRLALLPEDCEVDEDLDRVVAMLVGLLKHNRARTGT